MSETNETEEIGQFDFSKVNLLIATPCFGGVVNIAYMNALMNLKASFQLDGIMNQFYSIANESLITRARMRCTQVFLENDYTHLLFIDADIGFHPKAVYRLLAADKDVVGGTYPMKSINWDQVKNALEMNPDITDEQLSSYSAPYALNARCPTEGSEHNDNITGKPEGTGLMQVCNIPTGFMLIKRQTIEKMLIEYPDDRTYIGTDSSVMMPTFFDTYIHPKTKRYLSEDWAFCQKWRDIGGEVWCDVLAKLDHHGTFCFEGRPYNVATETGLKKKPGQPPES